MRGRFALIYLSTLAAIVACIAILGCSTVPDGYKTRWDPENTNTVGTLEATANR